MIGTFDRHSKTSTVSYLGHDLEISFTAAEFTRVFGRTRNGQKIDLKAKKMKQEVKDFYM